LQVERTATRSPSASIRSSEILRCANEAHIGQEVLSSAWGPPWRVVEPVGECQGPSGSKSSLSVATSPFSKAAKTRNSPVDASRRPDSRARPYRQLQDLS